jgi:hypothetical protein
MTDFDAGGEISPLLTASGRIFAKTHRNYSGKSTLPTTGFAAIG